MVEKTEIPLLSHNIPIKKDSKVSNVIYVSHLSHRKSSILLLLKNNMRQTLNASRLSQNKTNL